MTGAENVGSLKQQESSWDGWKVLLNAADILPKGVSLPRRNPDPTYIPTPPRATIEAFTPKGTTRILFSKDVFMYEKLGNMTVPEPLAAARRSLKNVGLRKLVPFVEISVVVGENSDPTKFGFDSRIEFVDQKTIEIELNWHTPAYVSAN